MRDVHMVKLGNICRFTHGGTPKKSIPEYWEGHIPWISSADISIDGKITFRSYISESGVKNSSTNVIPERTVLIVNRTGVGKTTITTVPTAISQDITAIQHNNCIITEYLYLFLESKKNYFTSRSRGATIKGFSRQTLEELEIPIPPLEEQNRIVAILDKAKSIQEARERQLAALDKLKHSLLQETIKSSTTQEIPMGKVISLKSGSFLPAKKQDGGKFPVYGGNGVNGSHSQYMIEEPTIIIGRVGAYCGAVHITHSKSWVTDNALIVTIQAEGILQKYLAHVLHSINLNQYANRSGQPSISATRIKDITIPIIPLLTQEKFTKNINNIDSQIYLIRKSLEEDKVLFLSLQSVLFNN